jgi:hypothetical protein
MGVDYESLTIGSVRAEHLSGRQAVGASELRFSLAWNLSPKRGDAISIFGTRIWVSVAPDGQSQPTPLGQAEPETAWCDETRDGQSFDRHVMYRLSLPNSQLLALEEVRQGLPLVFTLDVRGNTYGQHGVRALDDQLQMRVNISDWARVLRECGAADVLLVGVHLPLHGPENARAALDLVRHASEHLAFGHYTASVAECRRAIESLWKSANLKREAGEARKRLANMNGQLSMSKRHRELALGEALRIYCHQAHHVGDDAEPEVFGRLDAALAVSTAAALVSSLVKDPDLGVPATPPASTVASEIVTEAQSASGAKKQDSSSLAAQVVKVREHLTNNPKNRPGTMKKLRSVLDSLFGKKLDIEALDRLVEELVRRKIVLEAAGKLTYAELKN